MSRKPVPGWGNPKRLARFRASMRKRKTNGAHKSKTSVISLDAIPSRAELLPPARKAKPNAPSAKMQLAAGLVILFNRIFEQE